MSICSSIQSASTQRIYAHAHAETAENFAVGVERVDAEIAVGIVHVGRKLGAVEVCNGVAAAVRLFKHRAVAVEPAAVTRENNGITVVIVLVVDVSGVIDMENKR